MLPGKVIYQSDRLSARFVEGETERVAVCFPDRVHPVGFDQPGWGEGFLTKRGVSAIYIAEAGIDWFQCPDFFDAMQACRAALGQRPVTTYGSSMGGYAAILGARALGADRCFALSPQYSIDPEVVPFERRYNDYAVRIGPFIHDLASHVSDTCTYIVVYDPTHRLDVKHLALIQNAAPVMRLPVYGAGHGVLPLITGSNAREALAKALAGKAPPSHLRQGVRTMRRGSASYLRRMGNKAHERGHGGLFDFAGAIRGFGYDRLADKWQAKAAPRAQRPKLVVHCGLPKTGTTSLQAHFYGQAQAYREAGIYYPTQDADKKDRNHAWFSKGLRDALVDQLEATLQSCPNDCHTLFLSDESLFVEMPGLSDAALTALHEVLAGYEVEVVLFERDPIEWMRSFYLQSVQNRRPGSKTDHPSARNLWQTTRPYQSFFDLPYCQELLDFPAMRERIKTAFGAEKVTALGFQSGKDVVPLFCEAMGWPMPAIGPALTRNPSISDTEAEILRQANELKDGQARLIKALISQPGDFDAGTLRLAKAQKLAKQARGFPWGKLTFRENPPLKIRQEEFDRRVVELRQNAEAILLRVKAQ